MTDENTKREIDFDFEDSSVIQYKIEELEDSPEYSTDWNVENLETSPVFNVTTYQKRKIETMEDVLSERQSSPLSETYTAHYSDESPPLSADKARKIAQHIPPERIADALDELHHQNSASVGVIPPQRSVLSSEPGLIDELIESWLLENPAASLYAVSLALMSISLYFASPLLALTGVGILLITILHYAR